MQKDKDIIKKVYDLDGKEWLVFLKQSDLDLIKKTTGKKQNETKK